MTEPSSHLHNLPKHIDMARVPTQGADYNGLIELSRMARLNEIILDDVGVCKVDCAIEYNPTKPRPERWTVAGTLEMKVSLECQRCLEPCEHEISCQFDNLIVHHFDDVKDSSYTLVELDDRGQLDLAALVEEELLLQIPLVPKHDDIEDCNADMLGRSTEFVQTPEDEIKQNPFAVLQQLKK